ncbi:hypothetical protein NPA31_007275 [Aurantimonas sp. MSK8Z-1]|uniref:DUF7146 domain-containing protein n=1 Tax=Mangrovibrevibacter kandeliae TaxID=2968473 RepID=UPI002117B344|nr:hypothetical protein [Aurantimonas sp. MSK8Z-1]MCW4114763.1 hypothetical protein [Aurantimonas sp. MSK8Z-1]
MSAATHLFVEAARAVTIAEAVDRLGLEAGLKRAGLGELAGPCPACGGTDRFAVNTAKNKWNCRGAGGGDDAIGLAAHLGGLDPKRRTDFLAACAAVTGLPVPDGSEEGAEARAARERLLAERRDAATRAAGERERASADFRDREREKARGKWRAAERWRPGDAVARYLSLRLGGHPLPALPQLRLIAAEPYWHGADERGQPHALHEGPAMVAPFVDADGRVIGCHLTWIAPESSAPPLSFGSASLAGGRASYRKGRPILVDSATGQSLPAKKMRGSKKGGLIPLVGWIETQDRIVPDPGRTRLVIGEGVENTLAVAIAEAPGPGRARTDTLYAAAGDLGNLAGPADPASGFAHPTLKDKGGKRALRVQGPVPKPGQGPGEACQVPDQVTEILLVADGDSEPYATMAAMLRAERRLQAPGRSVATAWPPRRGCDFSDLLTGAAPGATEAA